MRNTRLTPLAFFGGLATLVILSLAGCTETETVYQDRPPFNPPPDEASGYLGYYTADEQQTTCGNCHVGEQVDWVETRHATAWGTLQNSGQAEAFCEGCHSVNSRGNQPLADVGYDNVKDEAYHDVQCESCHGPGITHVENPSVDANRPLASANVYPSTEVADTAAVVNSSCGACHQGAGPSQNHDYLAEWRSSRHGQLREEQAAEADCTPCHEGKGALAAWGVNTNYKELGTTTLLPQNCVVCHDPHGSAKGSDGLPLPGQLRFPIDQPVEELNLCTKCHNRRSEPVASSSRGPHAAQGPVLFGTAGYFPPGTAYDTTEILTTHGSSANPRLCAGCHLNALNGVDAGGNPTAFTGHSFHPLPCLEQKSPPVVDPTYSNDCLFDEPSRSWASCTTAACHGSEAIAVQRLDAILNEKNGYINTLWTDLDGDRTLDASPTDGGYLAEIKLQAPTELDFTNPPFNTIVTPAKGALFNAQLLGEELSGHPDGSHGVHNPFLTRALLLSSIADLLANYDFLAAPSGPVLSQIQAAIQSGQLRVAPRTEQAVMTLSRPGVSSAAGQVRIGAAR
jgi:Cytochrome c554 and c-prime